MVPNFPTALTWLRIVLIPVFVGVYYAPDEWLSPVLRKWVGMSVFALAAITDWLDGYLARRWGETSAFGAFLDPVADKLMVATALFLIVQGHPTAWMALWAAVIVGREIAVSALREWMAELGQRARVAVAKVGKIKTIAQMVALLCLLYAINPAKPPHPMPWMGEVIFHIGDWLLAIAALLTLWSGYEYLRAAWPVLQAGEVPATVDTATTDSKIAGSVRE
jgi:CDP-diacylglycerol--glycerol-3-phosphate 3-phosphatidyltransferase